MTGANRSNPTCARRAGLTVLELMLAVAITAIVALAISTVMTAASRGLSSAGEARSALQRAHAAHVRLRAYTDAALNILDADDSRGVALWLDDENPGGTVNLTELRVLWFDTDAGEIRVERVRFPDSWTQPMIEAADAELSPGADFFAEMLAQRTLGYTESGTIADGLASMRTDLSEATAQQSTRMRLTIGVRVNDRESQDVLLALGLPNHTEPG